MKRAIIALSLISFIFCSSESCSAETDDSKCSTHEVSYENFSCYKMNIDGQAFCTEFPDNSDSQKVLFKYINSFDKELLSGYNYKHYQEEEIFVDYYPEKESYQKGDEIIINSERTSEDDINIFKSKKTCAYHLFGKVMESLEWRF